MRINNICLSEFIYADETDYRSPCLILPLLQFINACLNISKINFLRLTNTTNAQM